MNPPKIAIIIILFMVIIVIGHFRCWAQEIKSETLCDIINKESVLTIHQWDVDDRKILCIVTSHSKKIDNEAIPFERLSFYEKTTDSLTKIDSVDEMGFSGIYPLYDGNLMSIWAGGSAYHVKVFSAVDKGKIKVVLEEGVKSMPEVADRDNDGIPEILFSSGSTFSKNSRTIEPESTKIYRWENNAYKLIKTVPWKSR